MLTEVLEWFLSTTEEERQAVMMELMEGIDWESLSEPDPEFEAIVKSVFPVTEERVVSIPLNLKKPEKENGID